MYLKGIGKFGYITTDSENGSSLSK